MSKKVKETPVQQTRQCLPLYGIWGIMGLFVVASVAYSTYMVAMGTQGYIPKVMLVPQVAFAVTIAIYKFSK